MCLSGAVVASWSLTQEVAGSSHFTVMTNIFLTEFNENIWEKLQSFYFRCEYGHKITSPYFLSVSDRHQHALTYSSLLYIIINLTQNPNLESSSE